MTWIWLAAMVAAIVIVGIVVALRRRRPAARVDRVLATHGAFRCLAAEQALRALADRGESAAIAAAWPRLEGPLLEALPDCPPDLKPELADALARCSEACANREVAQGLMVLRNSLS